MTSVERALKSLALLTLVLMLAVYYGRGLSFQMWSDSSNYLVQAQGLAGLAPHARPDDHAFGYPVLVAMALLTPRPALTLVLLQAAIAIAAFAGCYKALVALVLPHVGLPPERLGAARACVLAGLAAATLYSPVHVLVAALLSDVLLAALALAAVVAIVWLVLPGRRTYMPWLEAVSAAAIAAVPALVEPEWYLPAAALAGAAGFWLAHRLAREPAGATSRRGLLLVAPALLLPLAAAWLVTLPDRMASERSDEPANAFLAARMTFCNHAHLVHATLERHPDITLQDDPVFERALKKKLAALVARHGGDWPLLGFNGDNCTYDPTVISLLARRFPEPEEQRRFLLASLSRAALADPLPFGGKVAAQIGYGFGTAFSRFAMHGRPGHWVYRVAEGAVGLPDSFHAGIGVAAEVGPLGTRHLLDTTPSGRLVLPVLTVLFHGAAGLLALLAIVSTLVPPLRWRTWDSTTRQRFAAFVAAPLAVLTAHHAGIALQSTFDVWRHGFDVYFVNLLFMGSAMLFWLGDWYRWRHAG
ncbi:MAG: hypothetical protein SFW09_23450 [Hyphomicrobiaceae bacterium]|nr:hypothetical protein [Hyphomicrobiaceae bacterium]